jgi:UPF0755 protein
MKEASPQPKQRNRLASVGLILMVSVFGITGGLGWFWWNTVTSPIATTDTKTVKLKIPSGTSAQEIGQDLQTLGVIRSAQAWSLWSRWLMLRDAQGGFKAGTYEFSKTESMPAIAAKVWQGSVIQQSFTIPEGWSVRQMADYFQQKGWFSAQDFVAATQSVNLAEYPWLPQNLPPGLSRLEGYLYPDTYQTATAATATEVVHQMLKRFEQVALPVYQQAQTTPGQDPKVAKMTLAEWVTLSSIVEKEAVVPTERSRIAGVFVNRLKKGMSLGSDPTVEYGLGVTQTPDRPLTFDQVRTPNPYNTYINVGLPPTAIASPGVASLKATLAPEATDYLYFVARYDGTHIFSRTMDEHLAAQDAIHNQRDAEKKTGKPKG